MVQHLQPLKLTLVVNQPTVKFYPQIWGLLYRELVRHELPQIQQQIELQQQMLKVEHQFEHRPLQILHTEEIKQSFGSISGTAP